MLIETFGQPQFPIYNYIRTLCASGVGPRVSAEIEEVHRVEKPTLDRTGAIFSLLFVIPQWINAKIEKHAKIVNISSTLSSQE